MTQQLITIDELASALAIETERLRKYVNASKSDNTQRAYRVQWSKFEAWSADHQRIPYPADVRTICDYLTHLADTGASVSSVEQARAAIRARQSGLEANPAASDAVATVMAGIRRKVGKPAQPKQAMRLKQLQQIIEALPDDLRGKRDKALILCGFWGAFRRSELVALTVADLQQSDSGLVVTVQRSKTDKAGKGKHKQLERIGGAVCPVAALQAWLNAAGINSGALFRGVGRWENVQAGALDSGETAKIIKRACEAAGIEPRAFAGHSLRRGFVTEGKLAGVADSDLTEQTGQTLQTLQRYNEELGLGARRGVRKIAQTIADQN